ncbi:MAG: hypothetical protein HKN27_00350 [Silicimonas sp.]|nr:hypothetical protein [Silicimonas sp.]
MLNNWRIFFIYTLIVYLIAFRAFSDLAIDNAFIVDTFFIAQLGWREINGLSPVLDYTHFYGGVTAKAIAAAFKIFGATLKALDYAYLILFALVASFTLLLGYRRTSSQSTALIILLSASILIGPLSIEDGYSPIVNHSFVYNHFGMGLLLAVTLFVLNPISGSQPHDYVASFFCGTLLTVLALTKPTFAFSIPFFILVLVIQNQYRICAIVLLGMLITTLITDPNLKRFLGSLYTILESGAAERSGGPLGRSAHAYMTLIMHAGFLLGLLYFWQFLYHRAALPARRLIVCHALCIAGFFVATLTMNGRPHLMLLPALILILLFTAEKLDGDKARKALIVSNSFAAIIVFPSLLFASSTWLASVNARQYQLVTYGPLVDYAFTDPNSEMSRLSNTSIKVRRVLAIQEAYDRLSKSGPAQNRDAYVELSDGISLLATLENIDTKRIITANGMIDFSFPMKSIPVSSFPVWPNKDRMKGIDLAQVDIIMSKRFVDKNLFLTDGLRSQIDQDFILCKHSKFFILLVRRDQFTSMCEDSQAAPSLP